jgi:fructoselysine-6-P-deglycase FrlB-like protein
MEQRPAPGGAALLLSQTGTSTTTIQAAQQARRQGLRTITITADPGSAIGAVAGDLVHMPVGPEPVGPKTKGYTASILTLLLIARQMAGEPMEGADFTEELRALLAASEGVVAGIAGACADADFVMVMGQGRHHATALEASLKVAEMAGLAAAAFDTEEAFHGRFHGLGEKSAAFFIAADAAQHEIAVTGADALASLGIRCWIVNLSGTGSSRHDLALPWPSCRWPELDAISAIAPFQLLACMLAERRGMRPERMRYPDMSQRLRIKVTKAE